jgi:hypothetical protein
MTFCAKIMTNIVIIIVASIIDIKLIKSGFSEKDRKMLEVGLAKVEVMEHKASTVYKSPISD